MRILQWHGWVLEGSGSNVYTARVTEAWRRAGHDVLLLCQEPHPERFEFIDAWGTVDAAGVSALQPTGTAPAPGRAVLLRPDIGRLLPVFVLDEYEGFHVERFVDLTDEELKAYVAPNVEALRAAAEWHRPEVTVVGHAVAGPAVARRALGAGAYVAKLHGSDIEYAVREQARYADMALEGLEGARAVVGASQDILRRALEFVPSVSDRLRVVTPGVDVERFRPHDRRESLLEAAAALDRDPDVRRGRSASAEADMASALGAREAALLFELAHAYDQNAPDRDAAGRLRALSSSQEPIVGFVGKFIPQKGVQALIESLPLMRHAPSALIVGFGGYREWLAALVHAMDAGDADAVRWIGANAGWAAARDPGFAPGIARRITFTGLLDHRYAPLAMAGMDILVVPSLLDEAFGMVAAEAAAAGVLPLVARHSGLASIAAALEEAVGLPGLFSYEPGEEPARRIAEGVDRLLSLPADERQALRQAVSRFVAANWTWERTAEELIDAAGPIADSKVT